MLIYMYASVKGSDYNLKIWGLNEVNFTRVTCCPADVKKKGENLLCYFCLASVCLWISIADIDI